MLHHAPADGPPLQLPSESPGAFIHKPASKSGVPVVAVGAAPTPAPCGLHHSPCQPFALRLVSITKCLPFTSAESAVPSSTFDAVL